VGADKGPAHIGNLPITMFPDAKVVHLIRAGRAWVVSLKEMRGRRIGINMAIRAWAQVVDHGRWAARA
jgi:hypothetical protein